MVYFFLKKIKNMILKMNNIPNNYNLSLKPERVFTFFLKTPSEKQYENKIIKKFSEKGQDQTNEINENYILCKACSNGITTYKEKINVNGLHYHTFANPNGIIFDIACYKTARGCNYTGSFTDEFSWFKNYRWQVSICASCLAHLGWLFLSSSNHFFFGLIVDRLIELE
jgi:hypothetical protein